MNIILLFELFKEVNPFCTFMFMLQIIEFEK